jgi:hypothetical protein
MLVDIYGGSVWGGYKNVGQCQGRRPRGLLITLFLIQRIYYPRLSNRRRRNGNWGAVVCFSLRHDGENIIVDVCVSVYV